MVILVGAILNGGTAIMDDDDMVKASLYGAAGAAVAVVILAVIFWVLALFIDFDLTRITF